jgi:hypothetical protein
VETCGSIWQASCIWRVPERYHKGLRLKNPKGKKENLKEKKRKLHSDDIIINQKERNHLFKFLFIVCKEI